MLASKPNKNARPMQASKAKAKAQAQQAVQQDSWLLNKQGGVCSGRQCKPQRARHLGSGFPTQTLNPFFEQHGLNFGDCKSETKCLLPMAATH
jgi:hypothetical protein